MTGLNQPGLPLAGRRVVVTRTRQQAGGLAVALRGLGAEVVQLPTIEIVPPESYGPLDEALGAIARYQWLVVASVNAVRVVGERFAALGLDLRCLNGVRIAAVGPSTAGALEALGVRPALVPPEFVAESLVEALSGLVGGLRVLVVRAAEARDVIPEGLTRFGATVDVVEGYRNVVPRDSVAGVRALFADPRARLPDAVTFTSSSTVAHFFKLLREAGIDGVPANVQAVSIGPVTSASLREHGWEPTAEARAHDVQGVVEAALRALQPKALR